MNDPSTVRREYETEDRFLARRLTTWAELYGPLVEDATVAAVAEGAPSGVLDVGCGTGDFTQRVQRELDVDVVALDLSPRMVDLARDRGLLAVNGNVEALPFADETLDCVLANRVLYHVPTLNAGLAEIVRVLRPGGRLVAVTYSVDHLSELWNVVGQSPIASSAATDVSRELLHEHFELVERRDFTGTARFETTDSILAYLAAYGEFTDVDLGAQLGDLQAPFEAQYRHALFVARMSL